MSGVAEAATLLGFAINIGQVIVWGAQIIQAINNVRRDGSVDPNLLRETAAHVANSEHIARELRGRKWRDVRAEELRHTARLARDAASELQSILPSLQGEPDPSCWDKIQVTIKVFVRQSKIRRAQEKMESARKIMESTLLVQLFTDTSINLEDLSEEINEVARQVRRGQTDLSKLFVVELRRAETRIMDHQAAIVARSELELRNHLASELNRHHRELQGSSGDRQIRERRRAFVQSLRFPEMNGRYNEVEPPYGETYKWILDDPIGETFSASLGTRTRNAACRSFRDWLRKKKTEQGSGGIFWISGKPGSGKSTLVKFIMSRPQTRRLLADWKPNPLIMHHFFHQPGTEVQRGFKGFLCTVLYQLLDRIPKPSIPSIISSLQGPIDPQTLADWSIQDLTDAVEKVIRRYDGSVCIFVDGVDEMEDNGHWENFTGLIGRLSRLSHVKFCISCRPETHLQRWLRKYPSFKVHALTRRDVEAYARAKIKQPIQPHDGDEEKLEQCITAVCQRAEGVFLWVRLVVNSINESLRNEDDLEDIIDAVNGYPRELDKLYEGMWSRLSSGRQAKVRSKGILQMVYTYQQVHTSEAWMAAPFMPDDLRLMDVAFATGPMIHGLVEYHDNVDQLSGRVDASCSKLARQLYSLSAGLLEVSSCLDEQSGGDEEGNPSVYERHTVAHIGFVHRSAYDFLRAKGSEILNPGGFSTAQIHSLIIKGVLATSQFHHRTQLDTDQFPEGHAKIRMADLTMFLHRLYGKSQEDTKELHALCKDVELEYDNGRSGVLLDFLGGHDANGVNSFKPADFLVLASEAALDRFVINELENRRLTEPQAAAVFAGACGGLCILDQKHPEFHQKAFNIVRFMIRRKYDVNGTIYPQLNRERDEFRFCDFPFASASPFLMFMRAMVVWALEVNDVLDQADRARRDWRDISRVITESAHSFISTLSQFLKAGADVDGLVPLTIGEYEGRGRNSMTTATHRQVLRKTGNRQRVTGRVEGLVKEYFRRDTILCALHVRARDLIPWLLEGLRCYFDQELLGQGVSGTDDIRQSLEQLVSVYNSIASRATKTRVCTSPLRYPIVGFGIISSDGHGAADRKLFYTNVPAESAQPFVEALSRVLRREDRGWRQGIWDRMKTLSASLPSVALDEIAPDGYTRSLYWKEDESGKEGSGWWSVDFGEEFADAEEGDPEGASSGKKQRWWGEIASGCINGAQ